MLLSIHAIHLLPSHLKAHSGLYEPLAGLCEGNEHPKCTPPQARCGLIPELRGKRTEAQRRPGPESDLCRGLPLTAGILQLQFELA